jgi:hypothetical protein
VIIRMPSDHSAAIRRAAAHLADHDLATASDSREVCEDLTHALGDLAIAVRALAQTAEDGDEREARDAADALDTAASALRTLADSH